MTGAVRIVAIVLALAPVGPSFAADWHEDDYRNVLCAGLQQEVALGSFGRADCVSSTHAIEIDWADKFKEGVGQALTYATSTSLIPGLILICRKDPADCLTNSLAAQETFSAFGIEAVVWECDKASRVLADCAERQIARVD